jgi:phospholipase D3/4
MFAEERTSPLQKWIQRTRWDFVAIGTSTLLGFIVLVVALTASGSSTTTANTQSPPTSPACGSQCTWQLAESIPQYVDLTGPPGSTYTHLAWLDLINNAQSTIHIAAFYFRLLEGCGADQQAGNGQWGCNVYNAVIAAAHRGVRVFVAQSQPDPDGMPDVDSANWATMGVADVVSLDFEKIYGSGVLHTKFMIVDGSSFYVGSANFDWTSLAQVKEMGIVVRNCPCLAQDILKIWTVYHELGASGMVAPSVWAPKYDTVANDNKPFSLTFSGEPSPASVFLSAAPPVVDTPNRMFDLDALVSVIDDAQRYVNISVMDFMPASLYTKPHRYWPTITDALRRAIVERDVFVHVMVAKWNHTSESMFYPLLGLQDFGGTCMPLGNHTFCNGNARVSVFTIPDRPGMAYPFTRVNHAKYMVTDRKSFITTSNWSWDYYFTTAGVSFVSDHEGIRSQLQYVFNRDATSVYSQTLTSYLGNQ